MDSGGIILALLGSILTIGQGFLIFIFSGLKKDNRDTNFKIDKHIANYGIHKLGG